MAKPPADTDPERFIIGRGSYDNLRTAIPFSDERVFRIDPRPMPVWSIIVYNGVFAAFFYGVHWTVEHFAGGEAEAWMVYGVPIGLGLITCGLFTAIVYHLFDKARRLGPWLVYDKETGRVDVPREGVSFDRAEIVHVQYITTKRLDWGDVLNNDQLSELNLVTCRDGVRKRWPLLRSNFNIRAFDWLLKPLVHETELPVVRVRDKWLGWETTETPYKGTTGN